MSLNIALVTIVILTFNLFYQLKIWKLRALISPGFYYSAIWLLGVIGMLLFNSFGILDDKYPEYIDELNILISFTGFCFILWTKQGIKRVNRYYININYFQSFRIFCWFSIFYFVLALFVFFTEGRGLDFAEARNNVHSTIENRSFIVGYFRLLSIPLSIYAGSRIVRIILKMHVGRRIDVIFFLLPFFADTLFSLTEGGRVAMVYGMLLYVIGAVLTLPLDFNVKGKWKLISLGVVSGLIINMMISWIGEVRSSSDGNISRVEPIKESLGVFSIFYGSLEYIGSTYVGYQYRRVDAVEDSFGFGQYTFNGFINWQVPFASRFGIYDASIAKAFDIYYYNQETYDFTRSYFYFTHSAYIPLIKDFGFEGSFIVIFLLTFISHLFFVKIQSNYILNYSIVFFFFYLFFNYWSRSNFYGTLSDSAIIPLYSFLIVDFINILAKRQQSKIS